jgi:hypothetical protein
VAGLFVEGQVVARDVHPTAQREKVPSTDIVAH